MHKVTITIALLFTLLLTISNTHGTTRTGNNLFAETQSEPLLKVKFLTENGEIIDPTLYCHIETTSIAGTTYYLLKTTPADTAGASFSVSVASTGKKALTYNSINSYFVYQLTGISKILAGTINAVYRAYTGGGTVKGVIDIIIRKADGTIRATIASSVSASGNWGTSWATYTGANYAFSEYTVVDNTDYLEIDFFANVAVKKAGQSCYLRVDDNTLADADQTKTTGWSFQTYSSYSRAASLTLTFTLTTSKSLILSRSTSIALSLSISGTRLIDLSRSCSAAINIYFSVTAETAQTFIREASLTISTLFNAGKTFLASRNPSMFLSFSAAGSRTAEFTRFIPASLSLTLLKNQEADFSRSASSTISFIAEASRSVPETLREASLTISTLFGSAKSVEAYRHPFMPLYFDISGVREIESFRLSPFTFNFNIWEPKSEPEPGSGAEIEVKPYLFINFKTYIGNNENILLYIIFIIALIALAATILTLLEEELR